MQRATAQGVPVKGNFVWSAMDNLEWTDGYGTRFGIVYVDFKTQKRTPKLSVAWYREDAKRNAAVCPLCDPRVRSSQSDRRYGSGA